MPAAPHEIGVPRPALALTPDHAPATAAAPSLAKLLRRTSQAPVAGAHAVREPTFDELVTGYGRHRDPHDAQASASLLRRLALRARLLPTPARRPAARAAGTP